MKRLYCFLISIVLIILSACSFSYDPTAVKKENAEQKTNEMSKAVESCAEIPLSAQDIPQDKIALSLIEINSWSIPESDLISKPKPYTTYFFDNDNKLRLLHENEYLNKEDKLICAFRINESKGIYKSTNPSLSINQSFMCQINNELMNVHIPELDMIILDLLENESIRVKYSNKEKVITKNKTINDVLPLKIENNEYNIKISIKNFGLIVKEEVKTRNQ